MPYLGTNHYLEYMFCWIEYYDLIVKGIPRGEREIQYHIIYEVAVESDVSLLLTSL